MGDFAVAVLIALVAVAVLAVVDQYHEACLGANIDDQIEDAYRREDEVEKMSSNRRRR